MKAAEQYFPVVLFVILCSLPGFVSSSFDWFAVDNMVLWYFPLLRSFSTFMSSDTLDVYLWKNIGKLRQGWST